jgi:hypothetical protein
LEWDLIKKAVSPTMFANRRSERYEFIAKEAAKFDWSIVFSLLICALIETGNLLEN